MSATASGRVDREIPGLDGLRAVAALMVMFFHATADGPSPTLAAIGTLGRSGVDLFFVLSGFLITGILLETRGCQGALTSFYARRVLRIFPLYFLGLAVYLLLVPLALGQEPKPLSAQIWSWVFLSNVPETFHSVAGAGPPHYWSLAIEEHFYLVWPALVMLLPRRGLPLALSGLIGLALVGRVFCAMRGIDSYYLTPTRMDGLAFGAALALVDRPGRRLLWAARAGLLTLPVVLLGIYAVYRGTGTAWVQVAKYSLTTLLCTSLLALALWDPRRRWAIAFLSSPPVAWLGKVSYGIYVWHFLTLSLVLSLPLSWLVRVPLAIAVTFAVAAASFYGFERPFLRLKRFFPRPTRSDAQDAGERGVSRAV